MRALALVLVALTVPLAAPPADADWAMHYGALQEGCGVGGLFGQRGRDCPDAYHSGYLEHAGCAGEECALRFWHTAFAWHRSEQSLFVRSVLRIDGAETLLCEATAVGDEAACDIAAAVVPFALREGCHGAELFTRATAAGQPHPSTGRAWFNLCREGDQVWIGPSAAWQWIGTIEWGCAGQQLPIFVGCHMGTGGYIGAERCDKAGCTIAFDGWAATVSSQAGVSAVEARVMGLATPVPVCQGADVGSYAVCVAVARFELPLAEGDCMDLALQATIVMTGPPGVDTLDVPVRACRAHAEHVDFARL